MTARARRRSRLARARWQTWPKTLSHAEVDRLVRLLAEERHIMTRPAGRITYDDGSTCDVVWRRLDEHHFSVRYEHDDGTAYEWLHSWRTGHLLALKMTAPRREPDPVYVDYALANMPSLAGDRTTFDYAWGGGGDWQLENDHVDNLRP